LKFFAALRMTFPVTLSGLKVNTMWTKSETNVDNDIRGHRYMFGLSVIPKSIYGKLAWEHVTIIGKLDHVRDKKTKYGLVWYTISEVYAEDFNCL